MTSDHLGHIFEPLFTTKKNGTGLGLAISYQYVQQHQGHMFVESTAGQGTVFHVLLPAALPPAIAAEPSAGPPKVAKRILLVEDDMAVASGIEALLVLDGCEVETVHLGVDAVPAIGRFGPDCVILDIGLPDMTGTDVYREIADRWPSLPVLFSSGHADASKLEALRQSNLTVLLKPYDFETLRESLTLLLPEGVPFSVAGVAN
jgi:two-component system, cell cycle sensor histidine kinase and response regulator CckA